MLFYLFVLFLFLTVGHFFCLLVCLARIGVLPVSRRCLKIVGCCSSCARDVYIKLTAAGIHLLSPFLSAVLTMLFFSSA